MSQAPRTTFVASASSPDWNTIREEISCPLCQYNLRGLIEPRCPECGVPFQWQEVLNRHKFIHPYLFEHHPERNIRSLFATLWHGLRPLKFWRSVRPAHEPNTQRLLIFYAVCCLLVVASLVVAGSVLVLVYIATWNATPHFIPFQGSWSLSSGSVPPPRRIPNLLSYIDFVTWRRILGQTALPKLLFDLTVGMLLWPILTFLSLSVFQQTMARAKIQPVHLLRCVVYSVSAITCVALLEMLVIGIAALRMALAANANIISDFYPALEFCFAIVAALLALLVPIRLAIAYRVYLHFRHAEGVVLASQIIVFLAACTIILNIVYA